MLVLHLGPNNLMQWDSLVEVLLESCVAEKDPGALADSWLNMSWPRDQEGQWQQENFGQLD